MLLFTFLFAELLLEDKSYLNLSLESLHVMVAFLISPLYSCLFFALQWSLASQDFCYGVFIEHVMHWLPPALLFLVQLLSPCISDMHIFQKTILYIYSCQTLAAC